MGERFIQDAVPAALVSKRLGIDARKLAELRVGLSEGVHWVTQGVRVLFTPDGVAALKEALALSRDEAASMLERKVAPPVVVETLTFVRAWRNPFMIEAARKDGRRVRVRVKRGAGELMASGAPISCRLVQDDLWAFCGRYPTSRANHVQMARKNEA